MIMFGVIAIVIVVILFRVFCEILPSQEHVGVPRRDIELVIFFSTE